MAGKKSRDPNVNCHHRFLYKKHALYLKKVLIELEYITLAEQNDISTYIVYKYLSDNFLIYKNNNITFIITNRSKLVIVYQNANIFYNFR